MSDFTYEKIATENLETYEWDNVWWEQAPKSGATRVLYIGDSISCAMRRKATAKSENTILFDGFGTSKALDNPYFTSALKLFAEQERERKVVIFNNGLHGWHLTEEEYAVYYEKMLNFLLEEYENTVIAVVLTTAITDKERNERVKARNEKAIALAKKYNLPIIDLYSVSKENISLICGDGVHFTDKGYDVMVDYLVQKVKELLK